LLPAARAIAAVTGHMMESLQGILLQLRPVGLEEFGLSAALEAWWGLAASAGRLRVRAESGWGD
jgi:protein-histidine pros-kinase